MIKSFQKILPTDLDLQKNCLLTHSELINNGPNVKQFYLIQKEDYWFWCSKSIKIGKDGKPDKLLGGTILEFPLPVLRWFVESIEEKFMKTESEGGLKKEEYTINKEFNNEKLVISRWFGNPGYSLANFNRDSHINLLKNKKNQEFCFTDKMLFDHGLLDKFKKLLEE